MSATQNNCAFLKKPLPTNQSNNKYNELIHFFSLQRAKNVFRQVVWKMTQVFRRGSQNLQEISTQSLYSTLPFIIFLENCNPHPFTPIPPPQFFISHTFGTQEYYFNLTLHYKAIRIRKNISKQVTRTSYLKLEPISKQYSSNQKQTSQMRCRGNFLSVVVVKFNEKRTETLTFMQSQFKFKTQTFLDIRKLTFYNTFIKQNCKDLGLHKWD